MPAIFAPGYRRRVGSSAPAPTLTSLSKTTLSGDGGEALQCIGTGIVSGAQVEVDGTIYAGTYIGAARVDLASTPAHAKGSVSIRVKNPDGQYSNALSATYLFGIGSLANTADFDARDFAATTFPDPVDWLGRQSAGPSGTRRIYRDTVGRNGTGQGAATKNPVAAAVGGKPVVRFPNVSFGDNAACKIVDVTALSTFLRQTAFFSQLGGGGFTLVESVPAGTIADGSLYDTATFCGQYEGGATATSITVVNGTSTYAVLSGDNNVAAYPSATVPAAGSFGTLKLLQGYWDPSTRKLGIRKGKGSFVETVAFANAPNPPDLISSNFVLAIASFLNAANYGNIQQIDLGRIIFQAFKPTLAQFDDIADTLADASNFGSGIL